VRISPRFLSGAMCRSLRFLSGPERVAMGSIGSPKPFGEWAGVRGNADPVIAGYHKPRKHHDQENEK